MEMYKKIYNQILTNYYPQGVNYFDLAYMDSIESVKLLATIYYYNNLKNLELKELLISKNYIQYKMGRNFPCYIFQKELSNNSEEIIVHNLNISFLGPFFNSSTLIGNITTGKINEISYSESEVVLMLKSEFKLSQFPQELLSQKIDKKFLRDDFTFFNAFFTDAHRIYNF